MPGSSVSTKRCAACASSLAISGASMALGGTRSRPALAATATNTSAAVSRKTRASRRGFMAVPFNEDSDASLAADWRHRLRHCHRRPWQRQDQYIRTQQLQKKRIDKMTALRKQDLLFRGQQLRHVV